MSHKPSFVRRQSAYSVPIPQPCGHRLRYPRHLCSMRGRSHGGRGTPALSEPGQTRLEYGGTMRTAPSAVRVRTVFLDRDGVINVNRVDHVKSWEQFEFLPGAVEAIVELSRAGLDVFVITNHAIVNRG